MVRLRARVRVTLAVTVVGACLRAAPAAHAEVVDAAAGGFTVRTVVEVGKPKGFVYNTLVQEVGAWWHPDHTFSGDSGRLRIDARPGGCFCETLAGGGGVRHLEVVYVAPGETLRLAGGLGPLMAMAVTGSLTFELAAAGDGDATTVTLTYAVGGYRAGGLGELAAPVDGVLAAQMARLKAYAETGRLPAPGDD